MRADLTVCWTATTDAANLKTAPRRLRGGPRKRLFYNATDALDIDVENVGTSSAS